MKKSLPVLALILLMFISYDHYAQTVAMDFDQQDCDGNLHHLYSELDAGKVVVLDFIMLNCAPCIVATKALESITAPYESSHPGRVVTYSFGFLNSYTCEQLTAWKTNNAFVHPIFGSGESQVAYYGGMGMPTILVLGTNEHKVFYNGYGYTSSHDKHIKEAIDSALLYNPTGVGEEISDMPFRVYPTLFADYIHVELVASLTDAEIIISDLYGRQVLASPVPSSGRLSIPAEGYQSGIYFARLKSQQGISKGIRLIRK